MKSALNLGRRSNIQRAWRILIAKARWLWFWNFCFFALTFYACLFAFRLVIFWGFFVRILFPIRFFRGRFCSWRACLFVGYIEARALKNNSGRFINLTQLVFTANRANWQRIFIKALMLIKFVFATVTMVCINWHISSIGPSGPDYSRRIDAWQEQELTTAQTCH